MGFVYTLKLASFRTHYPKINFRLGQGPSHTLLEQRELDLCLIAPMEIKPPIQWRQLWSEELFVIVPKDHKFASYKNIMLEEMADESFIH
jgi:DNA-binding transcriptional LysR family regulator